MVLDNHIVLDLTVFVDYMLDRIIEACNLSEKKQYLLKTKAEGKNKNIYKLLVLISYL